MSQDQICAHERMLDVHDYCPDCGELRTSWLLEGAKLRARIAELEASNAALRGAMRTEWKDLLARAERAEANAANWEEQANDRVSDWDEVRAERDALKLRLAAVEDMNAACNADFSRLRSERDALLASECAALRTAGGE